MTHLSKNFFSGEMKRNEFSAESKNPNILGINHQNQTALGLAKLGATIGLEQAYDHYMYADDRYLVMAEARLDNRTELVNGLDLSGKDQEDFTDSELVCRAYLEYFEQTPAYLQGTWWFVGYDSFKSRLVLAQDPTSYNAFYYYSNDQYFLFSSSIQLLLNDPRVPGNIDLAKVIDREIIIFGVENDSTFFKEIKLLNPGQILEVSEKAVEKKQYWHPEEIVTDHTITVDQAAEELSVLFADAVRDRTRGDHIASMLSGGLDSSSVVNIAAMLLAEKNQDLRTFSHVPLYTMEGLDIGGRTGDERPYMEATVAKHANIIPHYLDSSHLSPLQGIKRLNLIFQEPIHAALNAFWLIDIPEQASKMGCQALLSGEMGNATISFTGLIQALSYRATYEYQGTRGVLKKFLRPGYHAFKKEKFLKKCGNAWQNYSFLSPELFKQAQVAERVQRSGRDLLFNNKLNDHRQLMRGMLMPGFNPRYRFGSDIGHHFGIRYSDPTSDIRVIEYMLRLPNHCFIGPKGEPKYLLKKMMAGKVPDKVLYQPSKGLQSADIVKRIQKDLSEIEDIVRSFQSELTDVAIFDKKRLLREIEALRQKKTSALQVHHLLRSIGIMDFLNQCK